MINNSAAIKNANPSSRQATNALNCDQSFTPNSRDDCRIDGWICDWEFGAWVIDRGKRRKCSQSPEDIEHGIENVSCMASVRLTCGTCDNGELFAITNHWRKPMNAHREMITPWRGTTAFFQNDSDVDAGIAQLSPP